MKKVFRSVLSWLRTYSIPLTVIVVGAIISFATFYWLRNKNARQIRKRFSIQSNSRLKQLKNRLDSYRSILLFFSESFESPKKTSRFKFNQMSKSLLDKHKDISNLQFLEYVKSSDTQSYQQKLLYAGYMQNKIRFTFDKNKIDTSARKINKRGFFPITYIGPLAPSVKQGMVGVDYLTGTYRFDAALKAVEQDEVTMVLTSKSTKKLTGKLDKSDTNPGRVTFLLSPLYSGNPIMASGRWRNLHGLMVMEIPHKRLIENILFPDETQELNVYTFIRISGQEPKLIYSNATKDKSLKPGKVKGWWSFEKFLSFEARQWVETRRWQIIVNPKDSYLSNQRTAYPWVVLIFGLGITGILANMSYRMSGAYLSMEKQFNSVIDKAPFAIATLDDNNEITLWNESAQEMFGLSPDEASGKKISEFLEHAKDDENEGDDDFDADVTVEDLLETEDEEATDGFLEMTGIEVNGETFPVNLGLSEYEVQGRQFYTVMAQDITQRKEYERKITRMARRDDMTGLYNRRTFMEKIEEEFNRCKRYDHNLSVIMIDLDHFKEINDEFGHLIGDEVLKGVAEILKNNTRSTDFSGRYGGEEFCMALPDTGAEGAEAVAERVREEVANYDFPEVDQVTCSLGIAEFTPGLDDKDDLLSRADDALYYSKEHGRNRTTHWDSLDPEFEPEEE